MATPSRDHRSGRYRAVIEFDMPTYEPTRAYLRAFVKEALESMGGCRHPDDPLFRSLGQVKVGQIEKVPRQ